MTIRRTFLEDIWGELGEACWSRLAYHRRAVLYSRRYAAPSTINSLYLVQQIFGLFLSYSVQSGNSAVGLIRIGLSQMSANTVRAIVFWILFNVFSS
jgi:hypothetical protein